MYLADPRSPAIITGVFLMLLACVCLSLVGIPTVWVVLLALGFSVVVVAISIRCAAGLVRIWIRGEKVTEIDCPRLFNVIDGLCLTHGIDPPEVVLLENRSANAAVFGSRYSSTLVVTTGAIEVLDLIELEALIAYAIARCRSGHLVDETSAALFGRIPPLGLLVRGLRNYDRVIAADLAGAELTHYPPGMQRALKTLTDRGAAIGHAPLSTSHLWLLCPSGAEATSTHPLVSDRIAALAEL